MAYKRKIQLTGKSTYTISLPREWIDRMKIDQGDELSVMEQTDGTLIISKEFLSAQKEKEVIIDLDRIYDVDLLEKIIVSKYLAGYTKIVLQSKNQINPKISKVISSTVNNLIGSEIIAEDLTQVEIKHIAAYGEFPIDQGLRRAHLIARNMQIASIEAFIKSDTNGAMDIFERETNVDKLYFLIRRELATALSNPSYLKELNIKPQEVLYIYPVAKSLEKIADHCESIAKCCFDLNNKKLDEYTQEYLLLYSKDVLEIHTNAIQAFMSKKMELAIKAIKYFNDLRKKIEEKKISRKKISDFDVEIQVQLVERNLDRIGGYGLDIAEMAIDRIQ